MGRKKSPSQVLICTLCLWALTRSNGQPIVPAIVSFGDSSVDVGNNDYLPAARFKADYPPYGRDFKDHKSTGRFCNGKLVTDITAETLGFTSYPSAYLSPQASGKNLLIGANFASSGSGYDDRTSNRSNAISLSQQLKYFKEYQGKLAKVAGRAKAQSILKDALYLVGAGSSDFLQNYYVNPSLNKVYSPDQYASYLVAIFKSFVKDLYKLGARRIGVTALSPGGCLPAARTLFRFSKPGCIKRINKDARRFNKKINSTANHLKNELSGIKLVVFDVYKPLFDIIKYPSNYGFAQARRGCCGTGKTEWEMYFCSAKSRGTCANASEYVFWDAFHPSEAANQVLADQLVTQGIQLIS